MDRTDKLRTEVGAEFSQMFVIYKEALIFSILWTGSLVTMVELLKHKTKSIDLTKSSYCTVFCRFLERYVASPSKKVVCAGVRNCSCKLQLRSLARLLLISG